MIEEFGKRKIEFAYPTQTLYLARPEDLVLRIINTATNNR